MHNTTRGQSGLDRLLVFVVVVIVLVAVLPSVLGFAGIEVRPPDDPPTPTPTPTATPEPAGIQILNTTSELNRSANQTVGVITVTLTKVGSTAPVDARNLTVTWANGGVYTLRASGSDRQPRNGSFGVSVSHIDDGPETVLVRGGDQATLTFDIGRDNVDGIPEFGSALRPGDSVDIVLTTPDDRTAAVTVTVPAALATPTPMSTPTATAG